MKLKPIKGNTGYFCIQDSLVVTYQVSDSEMILIDSGTIEYPKILDLFKSLGVKITAVLETHLHTDHVANNKLLINEYGTKIYAAENEIERRRSREKIIEHWGVKRPEWVEEIFDAFNYDIEAIPFEDGHITIDGATFELITLPGHCEGHFGIVTPDGVCCLGDAMLSRSLVGFAKMPYSADWGGVIKSFDKIMNMDYPYYALAHRDVISKDDIPALIESNIRLEEKIFDIICECAAAYNIDEQEDELIIEILDRVNILADKDEAYWSVLSNSVHMKIMYLKSCKRL